MKTEQETFREHGINCAEHKSFWTGLASHYQPLQQMGNAGHGSLMAAEGQSLFQRPHCFSTIPVMGGKCLITLEGYIG